MNRNWMGSLSENEMVAKRLDDILNHTMSSEDGETLYVPNEEAAEVYALLFAAWSDGAASLRDYAEHMAQSTNGSAITGCRAVKVERELGEATLFEDASGTHLEVNLT